MPRTPRQAFAFLLGLALALTLSPFGARGDQPGDALAALEAEFYRAVNGERERRHLLPLARDAALDAVARGHARDMARRRYLSHENPEGLNPLDRIQAAGIAGFTLAAENAGQSSRANPNREILNGWLASPVHRRNLVAPPWNRTGVGIARAADGTYYYTQLYLTVPR